jgi:hypothetical protein
VGTEPATDPGSRQPVRLLEWRNEDDGTVTVMRPKYGTGRFGRWLSSRLSRPHCAVKLDDAGSFIWKQCDGSRTMQEIANALQQRTPDDATDLNSRLAVFVRRLERTGLLGWGDVEGVRAPQAIDPP